MQRTWWVWIVSEARGDDTAGACSGFVSDAERERNYFKVACAPHECVQTGRKQDRPVIRWYEAQVWSLRGPSMMMSLNFWHVFIVCLLIHYFLLRFLIFTIPFAAVTHFTIGGLTQDYLILSFLIPELTLEIIRPFSDLMLIEEILPSVLNHLNKEAQFARMFWV